MLRQTQHCERLRTEEGASSHSKDSAINLADPAILKPFLARHGLAAKKGLGQHFLCSTKVVSAIVSRLSECAGLLEIGPGPGVLTSPLSQSAQKMIALELDELMIEALKDSSPQADVRKSDALEANLIEILQELPEPRGVVSNLPYYITGPLLTRIAEARQYFSVAVLMMQKEVGLRVLAKEKTSERGSLSVYLQYQFDIQKLADAPGGAFLPPPKVDSVVLGFTPKPSQLDPQTEAFFFKMLRFGFTQPRKTLVNNLVAGYSMPREEAIQELEKIGLVPTARPQELSLDEWILLAGRLSARY